MFNSVRRAWMTHSRCLATVNTVAATILHQKLEQSVFPLPTLLCGRPPRAAQP